ncbi:hypothetical protein ACI2LC_39460 [Nonomuraea wenchangensis]|uniref:hypothetical protein n=1 Tax=Nonomuraea wenchangensis TaxID=568860 RepID=UPI0033E1BA82
MADNDQQERTDVSAAPIPRTWHWQRVGRPEAQGAAEGAGAITVRNPALAPVPSPMAFVRDDGRGLWMITQRNVLDWEWSFLDVEFDEAVGAVPLNEKGDQTRPYIFARSGENLWCEWYANAKWTWSRQGAPPGATLTVGCRVGALTITPERGGIERPCAVVLSKERDVWAQWWDGARWNWTALGSPPGTSIAWTFGAVAVTDPATGGQRLHVYANGGDSDLWRAVSDLRSSATWTNLGRPAPVIIGQVGMVAARGGDRPDERIYAFVIDTSGGLQVHVSDAAGDRWEDAGAPPTWANLGLGAAALQPVAQGAFQPAALVTDFDNQVWACTPRGGWAWYPLGNPTGGVIIDQIGAAVVEPDPKITRTHVFLRTREGDVYDAWYG